MQRRVGSEWERESRGVQALVVMVRGRSAQHVARASFLFTTTAAALLSASASRTALSVLSWPDNVRKNVLRGRQESALAKLERPRCLLKLSLITYPSAHALYVF
jgi:hypothetical protein